MGTDTSLRYAVDALSVSGLIKEMHQLTCTTLGSGGHGAVYRVCDRSTGHSLAIKTKFGNTDAHHQLKQVGSAKGSGLKA